MKRLSIYIFVSLALGIGFMGSTAKAAGYKFITKWGSLGTNQSEFDSPFRAAIDLRGNIYVTDVNNNRIQKFTSNGKFITS